MKTVLCFLAFSQLLLLSFFIEPSGCSNEAGVRGKRASVATDVVLTNEECDPEVARDKVDATDATRYRRCGGSGYYWIMSCPDGTYFSGHYDRCMPPDQLHSLQIPAHTDGTHRSSTIADDYSPTDHFYTNPDDERYASGKPTDRQSFPLKTVYGKPSDAYNRATPSISKGSELASSSMESLMAGAYYPNQPEEPKMEEETYDDRPDSARSNRRPISAAQSDNYNNEMGAYFQEMLQQQHALLQRAKQLPSGRQPTLSSSNRQPKPTRTNRQRIVSHEQEGWIEAKLRVSRPPPRNRIHGDEEDAPQKHVHTGKLLRKCRKGGTCPFGEEDTELYCLSKADRNVYYQCAPTSRGSGVWIERHCPDGLVFTGLYCAQQAAPSHGRGGPNRNILSAGRQRGNGRAPKPRDRFRPSPISVGYSRPRPASDRLIDGGRIDEGSFQSRNTYPQLQTFPKSAKTSSRVRTIPTADQLASLSSYGRVKQPGGIQALIRQQLSNSQDLFGFRPKASSRNRGRSTGTRNGSGSAVYTNQQKTTRQRRIGKYRPSIARRRNQLLATITKRLIYPSELAN